MILVICNVPNEQVAQQISQRVLTQRLAACVNQLPAVRSTYHWQGQLEQSVEIPLWIKTTAPHFSALCQAIQTEHPYQVPEIIAVPISHALHAYADWVNQECGVEH